MKRAAVRTGWYSLALAVILAACASPVRVEYDGAVDFARYRTWSWLAYDAPNVRTAVGDPGTLYARLAESLEAELAARGLVRSDELPDVYVGYRLLVQRTEIVETQALPARTLPTFSNVSGTLTVAARERRVRVYETADLVLGFVERRSGRLVWAGAVEQSGRGRFEPRLGDAVARVLASYPPPTSDASSTPEGGRLLAQRLHAPLDADPEMSTCP